jgi:hypothetical protein
VFLAAWDESAINWEWSTIFIPLWIFGGIVAFIVLLVWNTNSSAS